MACVCKAARALALPTPLRLCRSLQTARRPLWSSSEFRALIPPKIASPSTLSASATAQRTQAMIGFYARLPKGNAPAPKTSLNPLRRYAQRYFDGPDASVSPLIHVLIAGVVIGYAINYDHIYHSSHPHEGAHH